MKSRERPLRTLWANPLVIGSVAAVIVSAAIALAPVAVMIVRYKISVEFFTRPFAIGMLVLPVAYGFLRGLLFHPVFDTRYSTWLSNTPWTPRHPLPKGPLHLVGTDAVVVAVLTFATYLLTLTIAPPRWPFILAPAVLFAAAITTVWTFATWVTGPRRFVYGVLCVPILFLVLGVPLIGLLLCPFVMAGVAWLGVRRSLATFPWSNPEYRSARELKRSMSIVGWPYRELFNPAVEFQATLRRALMEAAVVACSLWFLMRPNRSDRPAGDLSGAMSLVAFAALFAAGLRLFSYGPVICDALCWGRRIGNRRLLIWRHDQIFLAPLLIVAFGAGLPWLLHNAIGTSVSTAFAIPVGLVILVFRGMGPSVQELKYTGVHSKFGWLSRQRKDFITATSKS